MTCMFISSTPMHMLQLMLAVWHPCTRFLIQSDHCKDSGIVTVGCRQTMLANWCYRNLKLLTMLPLKCVSEVVGSEWLYCLNLITTSELVDAAGRLI